MFRKLILVLPLCTGCATVRLNIVNTCDDPVKNVEIKIADSVSKLPELAAGQTDTRELKLKKSSGIVVNYTDSQGHQVFSSAPFEIKPGDSGWVQLSITAKGILNAADGRKK